MLATLLPPHPGEETHERAMAKKKRRIHGIWNPPERQGRVPSLEQLEMLGSGLRRLPATSLKERMFFLGAPDRVLKAVTGSFPAGRRGRQLAGTHPLFVLAVSNDLGSRVCPCSTKQWNARRFVRGGCRLEITRRQLEHDSYLVEACSFPLPSDDQFYRRLHFAGRVPEGCIEAVEMP